jgi:capsular polysaccharide biosynthesis protein
MWFFILQDRLIVIIKIALFVLKKKTNKMHNTNQQLISADDEIDLIDLWRVLVKRKVIVLVVPIISLLAGILYLLLTPSVYESRAVIQVGQVGQVGQVEIPAILVQRLKEKYRIDDKTVISKMPNVKGISLDKKGANSVITLLAQDYSAKGAQQYLTFEIQALLGEHALLYNQSMDIQRQRLQSLGKQMSSVNAFIEELSSHIEAVRKLDPAQGAILAVEKGKLLTYAPDLEAQYVTLQLALSDIQSQPTTVLQNPTLPERQAKPKPMLVLVMALMSGLIIGVVAAFIGEFLCKVRLQSQARKVVDKEERRDVASENLNKPLGEKSAKNNPF